MIGTPAAPNIPVALVHCPDYAAPALAARVAELLAALDWRPFPGARVLVKPNLLSAKSPDFLPCTDPRLVRAVCEHLVALGARVTVGDSPCFGTGHMVAQKIGLAAVLKDLPVPVIDLNRPRLLRLPAGSGLVAVSARALEFDAIVNLPKLKVHRMLALTGAVKNHFGCVTSLWKALLHVLLGDRGNRFEAMLLDLLDLLPPSVSLLDAVVAMHVSGPVDGRPFPLGLLAASRSAVALDTAVYNLLQLYPDRVPLWREARRRCLPGADPADLTYPLEPPESFPALDFVLPADLQPLGFHPCRLAKRLLINTWAACCDQK